MKKPKLYFPEFNEEMASPIDMIIEDMKEKELTECIVYYAERMVKTDFFYCKAIGECLEKPPQSDPCGSGCKDYKPRNGKSGCCKYWGYCY